jgi:hypothetical protein
MATKYSSKYFSHGWIVIVTWITLELANEFMIVPKHQLMRNKEENESKDVKALIRMHSS